MSCQAQHIAHFKPRHSGMMAAWAWFYIKDKKITC